MDKQQSATIAQTNSFIILDTYTQSERPSDYQTEEDLEKELINDLTQQGYQYRPDIRTPEALLANLKVQLETLNRTKFTQNEWDRLLVDYINQPRDDKLTCTRKLHDNHIYDFTFDDGHSQNIYLLDKKNINRNNLQVINQFAQKGTKKNRYDVTILINGLPIVQIELKKRGVAIRQAFNQVNRYDQDSFNSADSLYKYIQIFVISNGTDTRYFANTTKRENNSFDFTMNWALRNNKAIKDLKDFTSTFFGKNTLLNVVINYSIFDTNDKLLIMRPYQIAATERIIWKIQSTIKSKNKPGTENGGYIWHTTGSGKTLTSFKAAQLATKIEGVDKVFFVVDRKDLDYQTMKEYQRFSPDSVNGSVNTTALKKNIAKTDNKIIVTTIQKLHNFMKNEDTNPIYNKHVVFIFDECHRSQFGEVQAMLHKKFKSYSQFGFTGTPIMAENAMGSRTTADVFGRELHSYVITDAIRDKKVLKFMIDYNDLRLQFKEAETTENSKTNPNELKKLECALLHPDRIRSITSYIINNYDRKTHKNGNKGFNALFAVSSIEAAKLYYNEFKRQQKDATHPLTVATIFSCAVNDDITTSGEITEESFSTSDFKNVSDKEFLSSAMDDYNAMFKTNYSVDGKEFQNYYRDLSNRVKTRQVDLLIVVGMFLTGFDAPTLNTLFVDKNLRYHGLIQAFSRTNRIYDATKAFGNIITFRDLETETMDAIKLFGKAGASEVLLERPYNDYLKGYEINGKKKPGFIDVVNDLQNKFSEPDKIERESDKKDFVNVFGKYLRLSNLLKNYDEHSRLLDYHQLDKNDAEALKSFCVEYNIDPETDKAVLDEFKTIPIPDPRMVQDWMSTYYDIKDEYHNPDRNPDEHPDWENVTFEIELLASQEINLDFILELILNTHKTTTNKDDLITEIRRAVRSSIGNRAKEGLIIDFIHETNLDTLNEKTDIIAEFFAFAQKRKKQDIDKLIDEEQLEPTLAKHYIKSSLKKGYASDNGTDINNMMPKSNPFSKGYLERKRTLHTKLKQLVDTYKGVGGV